MPLRPLALLLGLVLTQDPAPPAAPPEAPPRRAVAGVRFVMASLQVDFLRPDIPPHQALWTLAYPQRGRFHFSNPEAGPGGRSLTFQLGSEQWRLAPGSGTSLALEGDAARRQALEFELRRTLYAWPGDLPWEAGSQAGSQVAALPGLGQLKAEGLAEGRPGRLAALDPEGQEVLALEALEWAPRGTRLWPTSARLVSDGEAVWRETLQQAELSVRFLDAYFLPPDRRQSGSASPSRGEGLVQARRLETPPAWSREAPLPLGEEPPWRVPLDPGERRRRAQELSGTGWLLDPWPELLLDDRGRPVAQRWVAHGGPGGPVNPVLQAHGWTFDPPAPALACSLARFEDLHPTFWPHALRFAREEGGLSGRPWLRRATGPAGAPVPGDLILPLTADSGEPEAGQ